MTLVQAVGQRAGAVVESLLTLPYSSRTYPGPAAIRMAVAGLGEGILE